ncbi:ubiquinone biosynthesis protein [Pedobacter sp. HMWF019]|uniref:ABC1 kinase family protein n=1 Tax=Pedobacter sp. HMWF019 TaxID=2056856 RepID=UPI000D3A3BDB|nr:AarF/UbiB family protein [Pedobacter sp. HMWF019]PTS91534.1 ubiquinone biosynthesis protein [Pedobacter sp. HMWF019]
MMELQKRKLKRTVTLVSILMKYGFEEILVRSNIKSLLSSDNDVSGVPATGDIPLQLSVYERIRMALEELGPTYVKFGQAFSSREDLLPKEMVTELQKLQDNVVPEPLDVNTFIQSDLGIDIDHFFEHIESVPFASASISQVYKATLKDGSAVILKIKRSGIREVVASDMLIMKDVAKLLVSYSVVFRKVNLVEVLEAFEKSIFHELSFLNELSNIEQFSRNFKGNKDIYLIKTYPELSNDNILCMEYVDGIKITDKQALIESGLKPAEIASRGLDLYLTQVLDHGFFHADPHPGNLLVLPTGQIAFIDFGTMGSMMPKDKELLEDFISYFIAQDAKKLIVVIKKMAIRFNIPDEIKLERDIHDFFNLLEGSSLDQMDIKEVLSKFSSILNENEILMPEHLYLLVRGIVLIEGIGRALVPDLNIIESLKPYILKIALARLSPEYLKKHGLKFLRTIAEALKTVPDDLVSIVSKLNNGELKVVQEIRELPVLKQRIVQGFNRTVLAIVLCGLWISSALLVLADKPPKWIEIPVLAWIGFTLSMILMLILLISYIFEKKTGKKL